MPILRYIPLREKLRIEAELAAQKVPEPIPVEEPIRREAPPVTFGVEEDVSSLGFPTEPSLEGFREPLRMQQMTTPVMQPSFAPAPVSLPIKAKPEVVKEEPVSVPFWQRALQMFAAPFQWVDETIIKPGAGLLGTTAGFVSEVERKSGEDFWEWKKRSWAGWKSPGIDLNVPWSDDPWRLDVRGIMEIAPWLLIPGAGQVGGATGLGARLAGKAGLRAARGISGLVGKAGLPGRVLGTAIEYSPWGIAEKTAGVAIKGGFRAAGKIGERVSTEVGEKLFGKYVPPPVSPTVTKLTKYFDEAVLPGYKAFRKEVPSLRARQEKAVQEVQAAYRRGEFPQSELKARQDIAISGGVKEEFALTPKALAVRQERAIADIEARVVSGEISESVGKALITKIRKNPAFTAVPWTEVEGKELNDMIMNWVESGLAKRESADALIDLLFNGRIPEPAQIRDWVPVFGHDFAKAVGKLRGLSTNRVEQILDALNIGRSIQASIDLSATLRQGLILSLLHPTQAPKWFGKQVKALISEKWTLDIDDAMRAHSQFNEIIGATGAYISPARGATFSTAEELFASRAARIIPGIKRSERAFFTYLNQARWTALKDGYNVMKAQGATQEEFKLLGQFVDLASGRGRIPKSLEKFNPILNTLLFSPKLQAATLELPKQIGRMLLSKNPYMRKEAAKALATFVGGGVAILGMVKASGGKVELDPRAGDFGKIVVGETRLDIWRGYLQYTRLAAQMLTGERKSAYGNMNKAQRGEIAWRFMQSKGSPAVGLLVDLLRGETYEGKPIFDDTTGFSEAARGRILPLAIQDIIDAMEQNGINGLWVAAPAELGIGALTYVNDFVRIQNKIAKDMGYENWSDIDPKTQREIQNRNAELQAAQIDLDRQIMGTAWGDYKLAGDAIEDVFRENVDKAVAQYKATGDGYTFRLKVSDANTARRGGYAVRDKEERFEDIIKRLNIKDILEADVSLGPEQIAIKTYNDALWGDEMFDEFGDYRFDEAEIRKKQLRSQFGEETFNYVEEYRGVKYENFPPEYQELAKAKIVLRPYWQVKTDIIRQRGEPKTVFQQRSIDSIVSRIRKYMRLSNPQMDKYIKIFYTQ